MMMGLFQMLFKHNFGYQTPVGASRRWMTRDRNAQEESQAIDRAPATKRIEHRLNV